MCILLNTISMVHAESWAHWKNWQKRSFFIVKRLYKIKMWRLLFLSLQCYKDLEKVSITCLHAIYIFASDAFKKFGVDPKTAMVIPNRCHFVKPPMISPTPWRYLSIIINVNIFFYHVDILLKNNHLLFTNLIYPNKLINDYISKLN